MSLGAVQSQKMARGLNKRLEISDLESRGIALSMQ